MIMTLTFVVKVPLCPIEYQVGTTNRQILELYNFFGNLSVLMRYCSKALNELDKLEQVSSCEFESILMIYERAKCSGLKNKT